MDEKFEKLKSEVEREKADAYLERFGHIPKPKEKDKPLDDFN
jgi:hypothetical protein